MHLRLKDIFTPEDDAALFGDKSMVLFGDLLQLPPVKANPPFMTKLRHLTLTLSMTKCNCDTNMIINMINH